MDTKLEAREFYLDSIDEVFAEIFFLFGGCFDVRMEIASETSLVSAFFSRVNQKIDRERAVDFELCALECSGIASADLGEYLGVPVHTSSALEFFDYVFSQRSEVVCGVDFAGNSWIIAVNDQ
ncbi:MAG: hypothetical protein F4X55_05545 [Candidatus Dadabacteria bacterium]|nr:hypothetical protein [Candidatus Dadabacteria bacterium]MYC40458.1 hypothetical protein [Candidatus Dadabacteria bacterium]